MFKKSLWRERNTKPFSFFCPNCRIERRAPVHPRPATPKNIAKVALAAIFFTVVTWPWFEWKGIVSAFPMWIIFEVSYRTFMRAALACDACGFDPVLYLVDVKRARGEVEAHWRRKFAEKGIPYPEPEQATKGKHKTVTSSQPSLDPGPPAR